MSFDVRYPHIDPAGVVRMPLPNGGVGLRVSHDRMAIYETYEARHWWFWKHWRTRVLATKPCATKAGDTVRLEQRGPGRYFATINDETVLHYKQPPPPWYVRAYRALKNAWTQQVRADLDKLAARLGYHRDDECGGDW